MPAATRRETPRGVDPVSRRVGGGGTVPASAVGCGSPGRGTRHAPGSGWAAAGGGNAAGRSVPIGDPVLGGVVVRRRPPRREGVRRRLARKRGGRGAPRSALASFEPPRDGHRTHERTRTGAGQPVRVLSAGRREAGFEQRCVRASRRPASPRQRRVSGHAPGGAPRGAAIPCPVPGSVPRGAGLPARCASETPETPRIMPARAGPGRSSPRARATDRQARGAPAGGRPQNVPG
jgi:hypothetical protein